MNARTIVLILALISLISTATGGYLYYHAAQKAALIETERELIRTSSHLRDEVDGLISENQNQIRVMARFEQLQEAILNQDHVSIAQADRVLDHFAGGLSYDICYLMDGSGKTIASSNRNAKDSFVGRKYTFRPYFADAIKGKPGTYLGVGVTSGMRGIYFSHPVYLPEGGLPIGVAVIKASTRDLDRVLSRKRMGVALLVHSSGIIFASSGEDLTLKLLWKASPEEALKIAETQQFGKGPWNWSGLEEKARNQVVDSSGEAYLIEEIGLGNLPGWRIVDLYSLRAIYGKIVDPLVGKTGYVALLLCLLVVGAVIFLYVMAQKDLRSRKHAEQRLESSVSLLYSTLESTADGILVVDREGKIAVFNQRFVTMWQIPKDIIESRDDDRAIAIVMDQLVDPEAFVEKVKYLYGRPEEESFDLIEFKDGKTFERYSHPQKIAESVVGRVWSFRDVTERKMFMDILNMEKQRFQKLAENVPLGMVIIQPDGSFSYANPKFKEMFGYELSDVPNGREWFRKAFPDPGYRHEVISVWIQDFKDVAQGETRPRVFSVITKDGTEKTIHFRPLKLISGEDLMTCEDITDRKRAEVELLASEKKYRNLFEESTDGIFITLADGALVDANQSFMNLFGYGREEMIGKNVLMTYVDPTDRIYFRSQIEEKGYTKDYPLKLRKKDGTVMECLLTGTVQRNEDGTVLGYRGTIRDVTERKKIEEALLNEKTLTDHMIDSLPGVFYLFDTEGRFLRWNKNFQKVSGRSAEEIVPMSPLDFISHEHKRAVEDTIRKVFEVGEATVEADFRSKDGSKIPHLFTGRRIDLGQTPCLVGMGIDTTGLKLAEEDLRKKTEMLRSMFEASPEAIIVLDPQGIVKMWNPSAERIFGWTEGEAMGRLNPVVPDSKQDEFRILRERVLRGESFSDVELTRRRKDGTVIEISLSTAPLIGPDGNVEGILSVSADITKRKRSEEVQRRMAAAIEQSIESIMITDRNGKIQYINPAFEHISGYRKEEVIGRDTRFLKSDSLDSSHYREPLAAIRAGKPWKGRLLSQRKNGRIFYEDVAISPVHDSSGEIVNFVDVGHDVTENVELQMQLLQAQKMESLGTLAGGIAHDFNNLLQVVLGYSEFMLQRKKEGEPDYDGLRKIYQAGKRGADLVQSLLTFSRKVETKYVSVNLNQEITQVRHLLSRTIPKTIKIDLHLSGDLESIKADPSQVGQVLMNLGVNARDAMPNGGTLTIETANVRLDDEYCSSHLDATPGSYVLLTISDTGQGMDKKTLSHIFEPFFSTKEQGKGTGLGLATVYGIVKQHDGRIMCFSEPGHGTRFKIYLPAIQAEEITETPPNELAILGGTETVLLVDDDDVVRDLGATLLVDFGYKVITASNGKEALEIYQREGETISLIILDLIMPEMDGRKCLEKILQVNPKAKVIIASGYSESGSDSGAIALRAKGFVHKPYNMRQLLTTIREILDNNLPETHHT